VVIRVHSEKALVDGVLHPLDPADDFVEFTLCFPLRKCSELHSRAEMLIESGFTHLVEYGSDIQGYRVIGKGFASINVLALNKHYGLGLLKLRRVDSRRQTLEYEGFVLDFLEKTGYVPKLYSFSREYVFREYLAECRDFVDYFVEAIENGRVEEGVIAVRKLLYALYLLDKLGVDHGELNRPFKHVYWCGVNGVKIIDWESSSFSRKPHNLTSFVSFLLYRVRSRIVANAVEPVRERVLELLKKYKDKPALRLVVEIAKLLEKQLLSLKR